MENKDNNSNLLEYGVGEGSTLGSDGLHEPPPDPNALSLDPEAQQGPLISQEQPTGPINAFLRLVRRADVLLALFLILSLIGVFVTINRSQEQQNLAGSESDRFESVQLPLDELVSGKNLTLSGAANVTINGPMQLNDAFMLAPSLQPTGAKAGQIYYDRDTNQLAYFNGQQFVFLTSPDPQTGGVQSLGGATGQLTLGSGLSLSNGQISNSGVIAVQGQSGQVTFTAGPGIVINGTNFSNSGVISVAAGSPNVTVGNDGNGNVTISVDQPVAGTGTVTSSGAATAGTIPLFTASQNIESSIITQSGLTVTISGDLSVVTGGLTLSNALTVSNGGTGASSLSNNGVLIGNGTAAVSAVTSGGAGLCLLSTAGAPIWAACPSAGGVTSLNGLNGALSLANASAAGSTITIDDASTTTKGIASFNSLNFTAAAGVVNTVQNIDPTATPTFAGVNTNNITPSGALTVGVSAQTALLQGSTTTITSNGVGNNIVLNSAGTIELQDNTNVTGSISTSGDIAVNGGDITSSAALNITPGGTLTVGSPSQTLTLQGGAATSFRATSGGNTTIIGFTNPVANTTLNFPALAAGTYTICTTSGNCSGAATTLQGAYDNSSDPEIILDATRGALTIRDNATPIGGNLLEVQNNNGSATYLAVTASGIASTGTATISGNINTTSGALQTNGTTRIDNSGNAVNIGNLTLSGAISGGTTITGSGNINSSGGALQTNGVSRVDNSGNLINIAAVTASGSATFQGGSLTLGTNAQAGSIVLNDGSSNTGTLQVAALGQNTVYTLPDPGTGTATICLTTGNCAGSGGGVTTGGGTTNRLAKFTGSQAVGDSSISDDGTNVTVTVDVIIQGGDLTVGSASQAASVVLHDGNGNTTTLQAGDSTGDITFVLPTNTGTANQCLKQSGTGNQLVWQDCDGGSGGSSATLQTAYNNSTSPEIVLNSSVGGLTIRDNSTPLGTNLFEIQNNLGSTTYFNVTVSGVQVNGTSTATGNINSSGGALQTNGTTRIDNSGNAVNIGNITGSGAITIASVGAGNDITIDGADQFVVQDGAVFNALTTFNANIDLGANDIVGTTGNINLTNFDVAGATGNVTAGTFNGQTISSSANFTGTVAVASNATIGGDVAVNGGDITSSGALNITPGGTLTVGVTNQQLILQGSANTQLTATGGGFTTTIGFDGTPTGAITYNFDRAAAPGTYTICTTVGNCAGPSGGVTTPGGTTGTLAKFTGAQTLGDSLLSESGATVTVNGNLNLVSGNQFQVNGTQISSANLSNDANLAKLSASQTFTGNTLSFVNGSNSTNAFNVQNASGNRVLTVDTTSAQVVLGVGSTLDGKLVFSNMSNGNTVTILPGTPTANRTLTLPDASGVICTDSGNCAGAGATLQTGYNFSVGGTTPKIKVNSSLGGVDIQDADTPIGANLFNVRESNALGLGSVMFGIGNTGQVTLQNGTNSTTAFRLLTQGGTSVLTGDTTNGRILLGQSNTLNGTMVFNNASNANTITLTTAAATSNRTITLPDASGTICLSSGNCSGSGSANTLQAAYDAGNSIVTSDNRNVTIGLADTATDSNFLIDLQCDTSCGANGRFAVQDDGADVLTVSPGGAVALKNAANSTSAFDIQNAGSVAIFRADTTNGEIELGQSSSLSGKLVLNNASNANTITLTTATATANRTITLPDETGTVCTTGSVCTGYAPQTGSANYIQNQNAGAQASSNFWISGSGRAGTSFLAPLFDTATAAALNIGTTNATSISLNKATTVTGGLTQSGGAVSLTGNSASSFTSTGALTFTAGAASTWSTSSGNLSIQAAGTSALSLTTGGAGTVALGDVNSTTINIGRGSNIARTINIGTAGTSTAQAITIGSTGSTSSTTIQGGTGATAVNLIAGTNGGINITTTGTGVTLLRSDTQVAVRSTVDKQGAFEVQNSIGGFVFSVDTLDGDVDIGFLRVSYPNFGDVLMDTYFGAGDIDLGTTMAGSVNIGRSGINTSVIGNFIHNTGTFSSTATGTSAITATGALTLTGGAASTWSTSAGNLTIQAATTNTLALQTGGAGTVALGDVNSTTINIGRGSNIARTINIGTAGTSTAQAITIGSTGSTSSTTIQGGTGTNAISLVAGTNGNINATTLGTGDILLTSNSQIIAKSSNNSTTAFQIQNATNVPIFNVDTFNSRIGVNNVSPEVTVDVTGAIQQTGLLTSDTQGADATKWTKLGTCTITFQYGSCNTVLNILGGNDGSDGDNTQATVSARVKQQNALGGAPYVDITVNGVAHQITKDDIKGVTTVNNGTTTTVELWGRINLIFEHWTYTPVVNTDGDDFASWVWNPQSGFSAALPAGTQTAATYGTTYADTLSVAPAANTAAAFQVLNASAVPSFSIDNTTSRVYIGNPTSDTTGALLVLDRKSTVGDPTGTNGAMYYNEYLGAFRCYQNDDWMNCSDPKSLNWGYRLEDDFVNESNGAWSIGSLGWSSTEVAGGAIGKVAADVAQRPGQLQLTVTDNGSIADLYLGGKWNDEEQFIVGGGEYIEFSANLGSLCTSGQDCQVRMGLHDEDGVTAATDGIYFEYNRASSVNWRYAAANNGVITVTNSSKAVVTGWVNFRIVVASGGSATFYVRNHGEATWTTLGSIANGNLPIGRGTAPTFDITKTAGTGTIRTLKVDYFRMYNNLINSTNGR